jgi:hypothetical protein
MNERPLDSGDAMNSSEEGYGGSNTQPILTKPSDFLLKEPMKVTHFDVLPSHGVKPT